jgi:hypothetical protein
MEFLKIDLDNNMDLLKLFAIVIGAIMALTLGYTYYSLHKYTRFKGKLKKLNIPYTKFFTISLINGVISSFAIAVLYYSYLKNNKSTNASHEQKKKRTMDFPLSP